MQRKIGFGILAGTLILLTVVPGLLRAQVSVGDQLSAQYNLAKVGQDSSGYAITQEGTLLQIKKGGILGSAYKTTATRQATYKDGTIHSSDPTGLKNNKFLTAGCGLLHKCPTTPDQMNDEMATKLFKVGDKVYPTKISVDAAKDTVTMGIVSCDTCNNTDPPTYNKANLVFQFASGTIAKGDVSKIEDTIAEVLAISDDSQQGNNNDQGGNNNGGGNGNGNGGGNGNGNGQGGGGGQQQQQTQQIDMGQTQDQVRNALGQPDKTVNLGPKQIWVYKDLKVTFLNGRVVDVQ